jgi:menaquinone-9 beta-reductase
MHNTPVCIVGGGPAGLTASLVLSKYGIAHTLLERNDKPIEKVCGECYDKRLLKTLNLIDEQLVQEMYNQNIIKNIDGYIFNTTHSKSFAFKLVQNQVRVSTYRPNFDKFLLEKTVASPYLQYIAGATVTAVNNTQNSVCIRTQNNDEAVESNLAIVTTGYQALLSKKKEYNEVFIVAHRRYFTQLQLAENSSVIVYFINNPVKGYLYILGLPNGVFTVELFVLKKTIDANNFHIQKLFDEIISSNQQISPIFKNAVLHSKPKAATLPKTTKANTILSAERVLYAGSAVSHINPLTGWGVGHAVYEGYYAAMKAIEALEEKNFSATFLQSYDAFILKQLAVDFKVGRASDLMMTTFHKLANNLFAVIASNKLLTKQAAKIITSV